MSFDPPCIPKYSVIRIPYKFSNASQYESKLFVVLGHVCNYAICIKATSQVAFYKSNPEKLAGCVSYKPGEVAAFDQETVIQPDNQFPIPHEQLQRFNDNKTLQLLGVLPIDFEDKLKTAIENSTALNEREVTRLLTLIGL
jgi:hypothetical protein